MPARAWRATRDLAAALAVLALVQLVVSLAAVGRLSPGMLAAEVALILVLSAVALFAHVQRQGHLARRT